MTEILFTVEDAVEGGYTARAVGLSIFTEAETLDELRSNIREAVSCHFEAAQTPMQIRVQTAVHRNHELQLVPASAGPIWKLLAMQIAATLLFQARRAGTTYAGVVRPRTESAGYQEARRADTPKTTVSN